MKLGVNIDHTATLRQARRTFEPDPVRAAVICEEAGADSVVLHLREDRRHIQDRDLRLIKEMLNIRINLEMAAEEDMIIKALETVPAQATLVPEKRRELTTEGGLDVRKHVKRTAGAVRRLKRGGVSVSLFIDPEPEQVEAAAETGADAVEIHTGAFAGAFISGCCARELDKIAMAVEKARSTGGLSINAGHGLTYLNAGIIAGIPGLEELNIGHSIISRAVFTGLFSAVRQMLGIIRGAESLD